MKALVIFFLLLSTYGYSQSEAQLQKQYVLEGMIVKGGDYEVVPFMVLKNSKLGIYAISDERGYFAIISPVSIFKDSAIIQIDTEKTGNESGKFWFSYNPDTSSMILKSNNVYWSSDLKMIHIIGKDTGLNYRVTSQRRIKFGNHGYSGIKDAFEEYLINSQKQLQMQQLMANNQNVLFKVNNQYVLCSYKKIAWLNDKKIKIFVDGKRVNVKDVNKLVNRNSVIEDYDMRREEYKKGHISSYFLVTKKSPTDL